MIYVGLYYFSFKLDHHNFLFVEKINEFIATLKNKKSKKEEKQIALKFIVHLIGDLHQPLHVGNGLDRGGNDVRLKWFNESTSSHRLCTNNLIIENLFNFFNTS